MAICWSGYKRNIKTQLQEITCWLTPSRVSSIPQNEKKQMEIRKGRVKVVDLNMLSSNLLEMHPVHPWKQTARTWKYPLGKGETSTNYQFFGFHVCFRGCKHSREFQGIPLPATFLNLALGDYQGTMMVNNTFIRPTISWNGIGGVSLNSHMGVSKNSGTPKSSI